MTFGIDISGGQIGLNITRAAGEGTQFVIVKAVAAYRPEHTVADGYQSNIDRTIAAGLPKGHYLVPNSRNTPEASAVFMAENLHRYYGGDVLALDNEPLDTYATYWKDAECARFFRRLHSELGHPYERMWWYCPAGLTRSNGPWTETLALGVKIWWVSYGSGTNDSHTPDHTPSLGGVVPRWDVHQFTSDADVAGVDRVDGNYSRAGVTDLFGGVEMGYLVARPAKGNINTPFGPRPKPTPTSPAIHYGQDYGWGGGDAIYAARGGVVRDYGYAGAYGNRLIIDHGNGRQTWYCHLSSNVAAVGSEVNAGQQVAWMGSTGNVTAKHLHFELRINGIATDPEPYFAGSSTAGGGGIIIEEDDMFTQEDRNNLNNLYAGVFSGASVLVDGQVKKFNYGILPIVANNQTLIAQQSGRIAALESVIKQLAEKPGSPVDLSAVEAAAKAGIAAGVALLNIPTVEEIADGVVNEQRDRLAD